MRVSAPRCRLAAMTRPAPIQRGRHADRVTLARLRIDRSWLVPRPALALLVLRAAIGFTFLAHGLDKLGDLDSAEAFFRSLGIPLAGLMTPFVAVTETVGGLLLLAGLATPLAAFALAIDMLVAVLTAKLGHGFFGLEFEFLLGLGCVALLLAGAGRFSVDARLLR